ncbi:Rhamnogalacturonyl hydrolase YesR [Nannocystis exedens]|uniref:Rhamnogalacturonyl hydrolase YesR n=1 Tax=Nannocystis exedens TaxID=54 RepID=A0A1I2GQX2_9BACT|nr:glycosyl hydrolase [Nannocystis exedens]SFF19440.1 Rhamnogalacturonyl hydrolase YesR [Nannocystis exedens]
MRALGRIRPAGAEIVGRRPPRESKPDPPFELGVAATLVYTLAAREETLSIDRAGVALEAAPRSGKLSPVPPRVPAFVVVLLAVLPTAAGASVRMESPAPGGLVLGTSVVLSVRACAGGRLREHVRLDGTEVPVTWAAGPYRRQWYGRVRLPREGAHHLEVRASCRQRERAVTLAFESRRRGALEPGLALARAYMRAHPAETLRWDWGPAVFLYGLGPLAESGPASFAKAARAYLEAYHERWARRGPPAIDRSDRAAPALTAVSLARDGGNAGALANALAGVDYVKTEPRNRLGTLDHLGHSGLRIFYPGTIWVDSLMMYAVLAARWGRHARDPELLEFAATQPLRFASVLQDPADGLFRHAWRIAAGRPIPTDATYWLRGNGWALVAIAAILDELDLDDPRRPELLRVFLRLAAALRAWQQPDGLWDSLVNHPGLTHPETSGSALVAYALARAVHRGWIDAEYLDVARRAFAGVTARLETRDGALSLPLISGPTNPGPRWNYRSIRARRDLPYGVGPFLLAAFELAGEEFP